MAKVPRHEAPEVREAPPEPEPFVAPPQPIGVAVLKVQKQRYRDWIAAGGTPPIYT